MRHHSIAAALLAGTVLSFSLTASGWAEVEQTPSPLDGIARDYVALILEIGEHEPGYVDAYYGPAEWADKAKAAPRTLDQLATKAEGLQQSLKALPLDGLVPEERQRIAYLSAHVSAASARLGMIGGEKPGFADEAEALFGVRPELPALSSFEPVLAQIEALVPGEDPLADRVAAFRTQYVIPKDRLQPVMQAAIAECKTRTAHHMNLPIRETFTLEFVNNQAWSGYNWYKGDSFSLIQINTDLPIYIDRAVDLGCHEGYPGHHVYNALLEQTFVKDKGWIEMSVYPLFSPMSFIAEGSANYGIDLAFPGHERTDFEARVLYPLAGLNPDKAEAQTQLLALTRQLGRAEYTVADDYLAGRIDRETALGQLQTYSLLARDRAEQRLNFIEKYRSYVINYGLGRDMVQAYIEAQGPDHWATTARLLASQTLPKDLD